MIEGIERLPLQLQPGPFGDLERLCEPKIDSEQARSSQNVSACIAECVRGRHTKSGRIKPAITILIRDVRISNKIGSQSAAIGIQRGGAAKSRSKGEPRFCCPYPRD